MLIDTNQIDHGQGIRADVCIIGAGAAGITIARQLSASNRQVCLLESGGLSPDPAVQDLYAGQAEGTVLSSDHLYLTRSRLRFLGGSTNHWTGYCRPMDEIDFSVRPWVTHSGWPFSRAALATYYERAASIVQIDRFDEERDEGLGWNEGEVLTDGTTFLTKQFHLSPPTRFADRYRDELSMSPDVHVYLNANVVGIDTEETGSRVEHVCVSTLSGRSVEVRSPHYVLAAGGIENARLLLASDNVQKGGLGNGSDLVGRFFMEHPHIRDAGQVMLTRPLPVPRTYSRRGGLRAVLCPSEELQRDHGLLNCSVMLNFVTGDTPNTVRRVFNAVSHLEWLGIGRPPEPPVWSGCYVRAEQSPNPNSRVTLSDERDALGMRRARLNWQMSPGDIESIRRTIELLGLELGRTGLGRARYNIDQLDVWRGVDGGDHHMGTTRIGNTPAAGVVDPDCRVHGIDNLYVAGSSVFPTCGFANPTLTLLALALRLADHLKGELSNG